jgi:hypothetical protein
MSNEFAGGLGGSYGGAGFSGGGGGGGGASVIFVNNVPKAVAPGGGGGGGGGQFSAGLPNQNNPGTASSTQGGIGESKGSGDGAGGGGGGAGWSANNRPSSPDVPVYPGTYPVYNEFLNTYGVWVNPDFVNPVGIWVPVNYLVSIPPGGGNYYFVVSADNHIELYVNGNFVVRNDDWAFTDTSGGVFLSAGVQSINIRALNDGGPALFSAAMYNQNNNIVWNTRVTTPGSGGGGLGGLTVAGDSGAYSGENGLSLPPPGATVSNSTNGGTVNTAGGAGSITIFFYS